MSTLSHLRIQRVCFSLTESVTVLEIIGPIVNFTLPIALNGLNLALASRFIVVGSKIRYLGIIMIVNSIPNGHEVFSLGNEIITSAVKTAKNVGKGIDESLKLLGAGGKAISLAKPGFNDAEALLGLSLENVVKDVEQSCKKGGCEFLFK